MPHVVILGGGFGGLAAAHTLRTSQPDIDVTLVDRRDHFYMGFAKLWDLGGVRSLADGSRSLLGLRERGVRFLQTEIAAIDPATRTVTTGKETLVADALLVALGDVPSPKHRAFVSGAGAHDLYDGSQLPAIRADLDAIEEGRVVVAILGGPFKCPPAPFEAALLIDERLRRRGIRDRVEVVMVTPQPMTLPVAGPDASRYVAEHLASHDIELRSGSPVASVDGDARRVTLGDDSTIDYMLLFGVPASTPPPIVGASGLAGPSGWIEPDRATMRTAFERAYAVGDCTMIPTATAQLPKAGVFAAAEGEVAAANIIADLTGGTEQRFEGHGFCFLEVPGPKVAYVEGNFYAEPAPDVHLTEADEEQYRRKQAYETERLDRWLG